MWARSIASGRSCCSSETSRAIRTSSSDSLQLRDEGTTILLVAHDVGFVMRVCDHVYVLAEGRPLFDGAPAEVQAHAAVAEAYLGRSA